MALCDIMACVNRVTAWKLNSEFEMATDLSRSLSLSVCLSVCVSICLCPFAVNTILRGHRFFTHSCASLSHYKSYSISKDIHIIIHHRPLRCRTTAAAAASATSRGQCGDIKAPDRRGRRFSFVKDRLRNESNMAK